MDLLALPKTELHLHLEGAIPQQTLLRLVKKYGGTDEVPNLQSLQAKFRYRDFAHFIATWIWMVKFIREYEDFRLIASGVAQDLTAQGVRYAELHFVPSDFERTRAEATTASTCYSCRVAGSITAIGGTLWNPSLA